MGDKDLRRRGRRLPSLRSLRRLLIGCWVLMFFMTHWPDLTPFEPESGWPIPEFDRIVHFGMFAAWGTLWWLILLVSRGSVSRSAIAWVLVGGGAWAVFDECTQAIVGRTPDIVDFACDMGGLLASLVGFRYYLRRTANERLVPPDGNTSV